MNRKPTQSRTARQRTQPEEIDIFLLPTRAWDAWIAGAYVHLTDDLEEGTWAGLNVPACRFRSRAGNRRAYAFRTDAKRIDYTAVITKRILDHFSVPDEHGIQSRVDRVIMIGFCGTLKSDEFRLGDIGVASQVDCYMEKAKIADGGIDLCGEVYRTTLEYVRIAQNMRYIDPEGYRTFCSDSIAERSARRMETAARRHLPTESVGIHTPHLASATLLSTTKAAVKWLRDRDRKLFMLDMESGGMMAAVWAHNQTNESSRPIKTLVVRAAADFTDARRQRLKPSRRALQNSGVHNVCRFLGWMFRFIHERLPHVPRPSDADVGIMVPLEEEFGYLVEQLDAPLTPHYNPREGRFSYSFTLGGTRCACAFIGDMGLAQTALATDAFLNSHAGTRIMILVGVAGSINRNILVCDVALATSVDPYLQGARSNLRQMASLRPFKADRRLITSVKLAFEATKEEARQSYQTLLGGVQRIPTALRSAIREPAGVGLHCVSFASGDAVAADASIHKILRGGVRKNAVIEMEAAGMHVACVLRPEPRVQALFFRGISDNASAEKSLLDRVKPAGILRKIAMKNASSFIFHLLSNRGLRPVSS